MYNAIGKQRVANALSKVLSLHFDTLEISLSLANGFCFLGLQHHHEGNFILYQAQESKDLNGSTYHLTN